ncbi:hypothetical protein DRN67_01995 [Candidatus Micrarchaeota archaeon]|nr:MAG: hypothetical protein DRN67_01995 [Candidatus Micrarchaeota archaeon]
MAEKLEAVLKRNEKGPLDKFRNESLVYKQFGDEGVRVYSSISEGSRARELLSELQMDEGRLIELLEFMDSHGLITIEHAGAAAQPAETRPEAAMEITKEIAEREKEIKREPLPPPPKMPETPSAKPAPAAAPTPKPAAPPATAAPKAKAPEEKKEEPPPATLSPLEKTIYKKFGKTGLQVYNLIDGEKTAEEILEETGIGEVKLVEILEFMDQEGIIKLEKPSKEKPKAKGKPKAKPKFEPLHEEKREVEERLSPDAIPIDLPVRQPLGFAKAGLLKAELAARFGSEGLKVLSLIDDKHDIVEIARDTGLSLDQIDRMLAFLGKRGAALMKAYKPSEVRIKYGDDGLAIYRKYGRDGILVYELIGKEDSIKDIVKKSKLDKVLAVDIVLYIHKILGLELPLDRRALLKQVR